MCGKLVREEDDQVVKEVDEYVVREVDGHENSRQGGKLVRNILTRW